MSFVLFLLVSVQSLSQSGALISNVKFEDFAGNRSMRLLGKTDNAAGCFADGVGSFAKNGVSPVEDLKRILEEGVKLISGNSGAACKDNPTTRTSRGAKSLARTRCSETRIRSGTPSFKTT
ncbi:unnamed protein product [Prorocentrum cordatum]|uniref:Uncharacterized protein n=1 Tax=Prorocentrum cordatum TaxID=2364126 RepID=A0ABN9PPL5_9DINO|nr:unnamed protein product [Polarella glacialis]